MAKKPDSITGADRENDNWGVGQKADGSINVVPPDELAARIAQRNADEEAFGGLLDEGDESDED